MKEGKLVKMGGAFAIKGKSSFYSCLNYSSDLLIGHKGKSCKFEFDADNKVTKLIVGETEIALKKDHKVEPKQINPIRNLLPDSFILKKTFVPIDTRESGLGRKQVENFALKLNNFARYDWKTSSEKGFTFFNAKAIKDKRKNVLTHEFKVHGCFDQIPFQQISDRQKTLAKAFFCKRTASLNLKPDWRLVVGLGGASVYETSMTLHHIYGIPYIPASSIKGVVRSWIITEVFYPRLTENEVKAEKINEILEKKAMGCKTFVAFFGSDENAYDKKAHKGNVTFFDSFPNTAPKIEVDIMTPHYSKYYGDNENKGNIAPTDTESPIPIPFLTVADTYFQFIIGTKQEGLLNELLEGKSIIEWTKEALINHGIGAKTAVGYGYFE